MAQPNDADWEYAHPAHLTQAEMAALLRQERETAYDAANAQMISLQIGYGEIVENVICDKIHEGEVSEHDFHLLNLVMKKLLAQNSQQLDSILMNLCYRRVEMFSILTANNPSVRKGCFDHFMWSLVHRPQTAQEYRLSGYILSSKDQDEDHYWLFSQPETKKLWVEGTKCLIPSFCYFCDN